MLPKPYRLKARYLFKRAFSSSGASVRLWACPYYTLLAVPHAMPEKPNEEESSTFVKPDIESGTEHDIEHGIEHPVTSPPARRVQFGYVISKKVHNKAVHRNKIRRRLIEIFRTRLFQELPDVLRYLNQHYRAILVLVKPAAYGASYSQLQAPGVNWLRHLKAKVSAGHL